MTFPENLKYTEDHEWIRVEEDGLLTIGITEFAQQELGDIVYVEVDTVGEEVEKGAVFGTVEAVKTVSELFMPISGTVESINEALEDEPELVNSAPYEGGWIMKMKPNDIADLEDLLTGEKYAEHIG